MHLAIACISVSFFKWNDCSFHEIGLRCENKNSSNFFFFLSWYEGFICCEFQVILKLYCRENRICISLMLIVFLSNYTIISTQKCCSNGFEIKLENVVLWPLSNETFVFHLRIQFAFVQKIRCAGLFFLSLENRNFVCRYTEKYIKMSTDFFLFSSMFILSHTYSSWFYFIVLFVLVWFFFSYDKF